jgi:hypothetical protein
MDPVTCGYILGATSALLAAFLGALSAHKFALGRESRLEKRKEKERFREKYKLVTRTAYYLTEDIRTYRAAPCASSHLMVNRSFGKLKNAFSQFSEGPESDYLEKVFDDDTYTKFNIFTAHFVSLLDAIELEMEINKQTLGMDNILKLPLDQLKEFTDKIDEILRKGCDE